MFIEPNKKPDRNDDYSRHPPYPRKPWNDYQHRSQGWPKRSSSRGQRSNRGSHGNDHHHGTDSEGSAEEHGEHKANMKNEPQKMDQKSPKPIRKFDKDEKNRDNKQEKFGEQRKYDKLEKRDGNYVPKGEPSRHGRGGGNFRSSRGGLRGRIDGYGPPPSKSPFGHHDDKEKKPNEHYQQSESPPAPLEDKTKQNQQALAAGIAGKRNEPQSFDRGRGSFDNRGRLGRPKGKEDFCDTNSEHSDEKNKDNRKIDTRKQQNTSRPMNRTRNPQPPRMSGDKRNYDTPRMENTSRQNSNGSLQKEDVKLNDQNVVTNALADMALKNKEGGDVEDKEEKVSVNGDSEGFQEVKSKKTVKERQKPTEEKQTKPPVVKAELSKEPVKIDRDRDRKPNKPNYSSQQFTHQQIQNIPSLMATPVDPPKVMFKFLILKVLF